MAHMDREQSSLARRSFLKGAAAALPLAALPAIAHAVPAAANAVALQGTDEEYMAAAQRLLDAMPEADAALLAKGREWLDTYREAERLTAVDVELENELNRRFPPVPQSAWFVQGKDSFSLRRGSPSAEDGTRYRVDLEEARSLLWKFENGCAWPKGCDLHLRVATIVADDNAHRAAIQAIKEELGIPEHDIAERANADRLYDVEHELAEINAVTLQGLMLKAVAAARYYGTLDELERKSRLSGHELADAYASFHIWKPIDMVTYNLVAMALGNVVPVSV